jgi:RecA/RadA recombinase
MAVLRTDIERALDELTSQEEGMRFQGLAVVLGKKLWPELIARQRKKDSGLDAYAPASLTHNKVGKGLAASITPTLRKISTDAKTAKQNFPDLKMLLFVTPAKVGNAPRKEWEEAIYKDHGLDLHIIEREEIITQLLMPENASLRSSFLLLDIDAEPQVLDLIDRTRRAANAVTQAWAVKTKGHPLIDLAAVRIDLNGAESADVMSLEQIGQALSRSRRIVVEGPAGRGKTTTLIQLAQRIQTAGTAFMIELPAWTSSRRGILEYIAGMPAFQAEGLTAVDLAKVQQTEPFLLLLNGWNEIAESNSLQADEALRELERDFPSAGIIVATRTHHLTPPLPGALRLRLLRLGREQRASYLTARFGSKGAVLRARIDSDQSLDELTRTPFILSEVASLFEAGADIPSTKFDVLTQVIRLQEQRHEHRNALQATPIFGRQTDHLKALATVMSRRGAVALPEADARAVAATAVRELVHFGQIEPVGASSVLATLSAHHVLERIDYPHTAFQFEHQQLQEYFAGLDIRARLLDLRGDDPDATARFTIEYVNDPAWGEPLRMIAETFAEQPGEAEANTRNTRAGASLVAMALAVDLVFAGELARLCGANVWKLVRTLVVERCRTTYAIHDEDYRQYALAAMLATGANDFSDIIVPLLSGEDQQARLGTYRLWPDIQVLSLGQNWREQVRGWTDEARVDFVSEVLQHGVDAEVLKLAIEDNCIEVKKAAISVLMWTSSADALTCVLESTDEKTFEDVTHENADLMPPALKQKTFAAMRKFVAGTANGSARLRTVLQLIELGEPGMDRAVKGAIDALSTAEMRNLGIHYIQPALMYLQKSDPAWVSEWVAMNIVEGFLYDHEHWLQFATAIPDGLAEKYLRRLETEDFENAHLRGVVAVVAAHADASIAARVFTSVRDLRCKVNAGLGERNKFAWKLMDQLEAIYRHLKGDIAAAGILTSAREGDPLDIKVAVHFLSRVARPEVESICIVDGDLKARLRSYLIASVGLVICQDDFSGEDKAHLASSIAQVGQPEDLANLVTLIRADIDRIRRGRAAHAAGDRGPLGNGGSMSYAGWNIAAVIRLNPTGADQLLIDLLSEPEYSSEAAAAMARNFLPKPVHLFERTFRYDLVWAARAHTSPPGDAQRRAMYVAALHAATRHLQAQNQNGKLAPGVNQLANALDVIDGRGSLATVLDIIVMPSQWDEYLRLDTAERLLMSGAVLPATTMFALIDAILMRTEKWMQDSDRILLRRLLALCPFVDDPAVGITKMRYVLGIRRLEGFELRELVAALGQSRTCAAIDLLCELASNAETFEQCQDYFIDAIATFNTRRAREMLMSFVDPNIQGFAPTRQHHHEDKLIAHLAELARRRVEVATRLQELCELDLPELNRHVLSKVLHRLGTPEALAANLGLINDAKPSPVPAGVFNQLEDTFVERRPSGSNANVFTAHARASNEMRARFFRMAVGDLFRRKSAFMLLGRIEVWRLEYGRPLGEPRHPDFGSGQSWPITTNIE